MAPSAGSKAAFQGTIGTLHGIGLIMTVFRATYRWKRGAFFWDDGVAGVAGCFDAVHFAMLFVRIVQADRRHKGFPLTAHEAITSYMIESLSYTSTIWTARASIALSILRVLPSCALRKIILGIIVSFACTWLSLCAAKISICTRNATVRTAGDCHLGAGFVIIKLCLDIVANLALVIISMIMMWHSQLPHVPRRMIRAIFALNILITAASCVHVVAQLRLDDILEGFTAYYESAITLIACNLLVVATYIYRRLRGQQDNDPRLPSTA